jgi:hypothetical protein
MIEDRVGKVFMMFGHDTSRCLVCERLFTCDAAREHSDIPCDPAAPDLWLINNAAVPTLPLSMGA